MATRTRTHKTTADAEAAAAQIAAAAAAPTKPQQPTISQSEIVLLVQRHQQLTAAAKAAYAERDGIEAKLFSALPVGAVISLPDGRSAKIVDNFIDANGNPRNTAFRPCGVSRFELKVK